MNDLDDDFSAYIESLPSVRGTIEGIYDRRELTDPNVEMTTPADYDNIRAIAVAEIKSFGSGTRLAYAVLQLLYELDQETATPEEMKALYGDDYGREDAWLGPLR